MHILVKDKNFYRQLAAITIPIALQNLITFGVAMSDTVMLGFLGEIQLSAAAIANQLGFIHMLVAFGAGSGAGVLIAQFWGKGNTESIHKVVTISIRIMLAASMIFTALALFCPKFVISIFTTDEDVIAEAVKFMRIVGFSYTFAGVTNAIIIMLRSVRSVKISVVTYLVSLSLSVFFNWVLIFGKLGFPALGVRGAAISTCIARFTELLIVVIYLRFFDNKLNYRLKMLFATNLNIIQNFMSNAMPVIVNELAWGAGTAVYAVIIGRMGREFTAANAVCTVLSQLVTIMLFGVANGGGVIIGNTIGKGKYKLAKHYSSTIMIISLSLGIVSSIVVLLLKNPMISLYNISPVAKGYANQIITIFSVIVIFVAMASVELLGVLRAGGDTRFVLFMDVGFMWLICIPLGFFTGLYLHWPVWAVYMVIKSDEVLKVICATIRIIRGKWINDVTII